VEIGPNSFGIYIAGDEEILYLPPSVYYDKLPDNVVIFQRGRLRYRTLDANVIESNPNPEDPACSSVICEYAISRVVVKDSNRDASVNVDVLFRFIEDPARVEDYRFVGSMLQVVQNYIATPSRTMARAYGSQFTTAELRTPEGKAAFGEVLRIAIQENIDSANIPINVESVNIRSADLNDEELREAAYLADIADTEAEARISAAQSELEALEAEESVRQANIDISQAEYERWLQNTQNLLTAFHNSELPWELFWVMFSSDMIELQMGPDGRLVAPGSYYFPQQNGQPNVVPTATPVLP
jgi:hypothetical protein